jgi:formylglycine-generating enzyme required for sulfatase activity
MVYFHFSLQPLTCKHVRRRGFVCASAALVMLLLIFFAPAVVAQMPPVLDLQLTAGNSRLSVSGNAGAPCVVQYATDLVAGATWAALSNITLTATPAIVAEPFSSLTNRRFYRVVINVPSNSAWVPAGSFVMGSPTNEAGRGPNSETQHTVTLSKGFYAGKYLVTQRDYLSLMNTNPSWFNTNHGYTLDLSRPVEQVSWFDATNYCGQLTQRERLAGRIFSTWSYRLPTEAEWEYLCRAGTTTQFYYGTNLLSGMANFDGHYEYRGTGTVFNTNGIVLNRTAAVGGYQPNGFGIYDLAGNVWEWCQDWYAAFTSTPVTNPTGAASGSQRVFRGGTFTSPGVECRSAERNRYEPASRFNTLGFRVVLSGP